MSIFNRSQVGETVANIQQLCSNPLFRSSYVVLVAPEDIIRKVVNTIQFGKRIYTAAGRAGIIYSNTLLKYSIKREYWFPSDRDDSHQIHYKYDVIKIIASSSLVYLRDSIRLLGKDIIFIYVKEGKEWKSRHYLWNRGAIYIQLRWDGHDETINVGRGVKHEIRCGEKCCGCDFSFGDFASTHLAYEYGDRYYCKHCNPKHYDLPTVAFIPSLIDGREIPKKYMKLAASISHYDIIQIVPGVWRSGKYDIIDSRYEADYEPMRGTKLVIIDTSADIDDDLTKGFAFGICDF